MIKDYPFASNGKSCMISISAEERPSLKLTIEASSQKNRVGCCRIHPCRGKRQTDPYKKIRRKFYFFVKISHIKYIKQKNII